MSNVENDIARLERAFTQGLGVDLAEFDDPEQAAARAALYAQDQADAAAQAAAAEDPATPATEAAKKLADEQGVDLATVEPTGAEGQIVKADVAAAVEGSES